MKLPSTNFILFALLCFSLILPDVLAQNSTDELLDAPTARNFIFLWHNFDQKRFEYELDQATTTANSKPISTSLTVAASRKDRALKVIVLFYNPLQYSFKVSDVLLTEPSFQSIGSFGELAAGLLKELATTQTSAAGTAFADEKAKMILAARASRVTTPTVTSATVPAIALAAVETVLSLKSSELAEWGYLVIKGGSTCVNWDAVSIDKLKRLDAEFINAGFTSTMTTNLQALKDAGNITNFQSANERLGTSIESMKAANNTNTVNLTAFSREIDSDNFLITSTGVAECQSFEHYSRIVFQRFIEACKVIQVKREKLADAAEKIQLESKNLIAKAPLKIGVVGSERDNRFELGVYEVLTDKMRDVTVVMQKRQANFSGETSEVKDLEEKISGIIRIRTYQKWIPEFSTGLYFSNVAFAKYNAKVINTTDATGKSQSETVLDPEVGEERTPFVMAGMLNMTLNTYSGSIHPLGQVGIGTGKNGVSLLGGLGIRLRAVNPIILSAGVIVPWNKAPKNIKPDQKVSGQSEIDSDLRLRELGKARPYIGIQYNF